MSNSSVNFNPPPGLRNPHVQSALRSFSFSQVLARHRARELLGREQQWLMDGGNGVRLQGFFTPAHQPGRALAVLLHG